MVWLRSTILVLSAVVAHALATVPASSVSNDVWDNLNATVGGRLYQGTPLSLPCFSVYNNITVQRDEGTCSTVQAEYTNNTFRVDKFGAYMMTHWETCQRTSEQCILDLSDLADPQAWTEYNCSQGSVSPYYIDVQDESDVQAAYNFSQSTGVNLAIKNTGHDYKGRSSSKESLGLWTHNLKSMSYNQSFTPTGCSGTSNKAITLGAGVVFEEAYQFADDNNVTIIGGYDATVGASGGWLLGGGHGILTPVYGLGVDRALEFKIVTPDGEVRVANQCQNEDLFWALRGGGGGTFGVVLQSTVKVEPVVPMQVAYLSFTADDTNQAPWLELMINNTYKWATEGWGGHIRGENLINVNPLLSLEEAKDSMKDAVAYVEAQGGNVTIETQPSWYSFFVKYALPAEAPVGQEDLLASRLMPASLFESEEGRSSLNGAIAEILTIADPYIVFGTPWHYNQSINAANETSITPAFYSSLWHLVFWTSMTFNYTLEQKQSTYELGNQVTQSLYTISPDSGAYFNEGLVYEPNHEQSYWGPNYDRLVSIKHKYDPSGLLDCWQCVGWKGASDPLYSCYPLDPSNSS